MAQRTNKPLLAGPPAAAFRLGEKMLKRPFGMLAGATVAFAGFTASAQED
jgi:hypothetical protein